jgi:DNA-binding LacI/PurR family transcriptional regulator
VTTIAEVAEEAGVGVGTVSRVLNGNPSVRDSTRRRVLDVIAALGYEPSPAARALSTGRTHAIGVVAPFFTRPSVTERLRGVAQRLDAAGYQLNLLDVERPEQRDASFRALAVRGRVDGLLSISLLPTEAELARLRAARVPVVLVDRRGPGLPSVHIDNLGGGRMATRHLLELGHERIAFVGDEEENPYGFDSSAQRRAGYEAALREAGLEPDPGLVHRRPHGRGSARELARALLAGPAAPTAVVAASDLQALGVLEAAESVGLAVPRDLSLVGFDDVELARYVGLTTVSQPLEESGWLGAHMLLAALGGASPPARELPLALVVRATTCPRRPANPFVAPNGGAGTRSRAAAGADALPG